MTGSPVGNSFTGGGAEEATVPATGGNLLDAIDPVVFGVAPEAGRFEATFPGPRTMS